MCVFYLRFWCGPWINLPPPRFGKIRDTCIHRYIHASKHTECTPTLMQIYMFKLIIGTTSTEHFFPSPSAPLPLTLSQTLHSHFFYLAVSLSLGVSGPFTCACDLNLHNKQHTYTPCTQQTCAQQCKGAQTATSGNGKPWSMAYKGPSTPPKPPVLPCALSNT